MPLHPSSTLCLPNPATPLWSSSLLHRFLWTAALWALTDHTEFSAILSQPGSITQGNLFAFIWIYSGLVSPIYPSCRSVELELLCFPQINVAAQCVISTLAQCSLLPSLYRTAFLFLPSSPLSSLLAVQTINSHHPSASDNCTGHKQGWFSLCSITDFAVSQLLLYLVKKRDLWTSKARGTIVLIQPETA